ncbi:MAG: hypothetical protein Q7J73_07540 [Dehalococcoidales bacterium]|nr:hypothetical protein [Dehalococcoidales bacterium]
MEEKPDNKTNPKGGNMLLRIVSGVLAVVVIVAGVLYSMEVGKLNEAKQDIASLEGQLTTEKAHATDLQTQLTAAKAQATTLTADLTTANTKVTSLTADLATANTRVTGLTTDLATANTRIATLTADLATANARVTTLTTNLATANATIVTLTADRAIANTQITSLTGELATANTNYRKVADPRHFFTVQELTDWLARDDTNTNPAYVGLRNSEKAYILMIRALRDGLLLPAALDYSNGITYYKNTAVVVGDIYDINVATDAIVLQGTTSPYFSHPLPLP